MGGYDHLIQGPWIMAPPNLKLEPAPACYRQVRVQLKICRSHTPAPQPSTPSSSPPAHPALPFPPPSLRTPPNDDLPPGWKTKVGPSPV